MLERRSWRWKSFERGRPCFSREFTLPIILTAVFILNSALHSSPNPLSTVVLVQCITSRYGRRNSTARLYIVRA